MNGLRKLTAKNWYENFETQEKAREFIHAELLHNAAPDKTKEFAKFLIALLDGAVTCSIYEMEDQLKAFHVSEGMESYGWPLLGLVDSRR